MKKLFAAAIAALIAYGGIAAAQQVGSSPSSNSLGVTSVGPNFTTAGKQLNLTQPINSQGGTTYPIAATDNGKIVKFTNAAGVASSLSSASSIGFTSGFSFYAQNAGAGTDVITPTTGTTINGSPSLSLLQNQGCLITSDGVSNYTLSGCQIQTPGTAITAVEGGAPCTAIERFGASPSATAATNKTAIDTALALGAGCYTLTTPGTYLDNFNHTAYSDSTFYVGPGVHIEQASGANEQFMSNANWQSASVTLSSAITEAAITNSNRLSSATAVWPSTPTVVVGGYMEIRGDTTGYYNGIWKVTGVSGNNVTFTVPGQVSISSAGTVLAAPADANITIRVEGVIDYNEPQNTASSSTVQSVGFVFNRVGNLRADPLNYINGNKFAIYCGNTFNSAFKNLWLSTGSDGVHCDGLIQNLTIQSLKGNTGDDSIALATNDSIDFPLNDGTGAMNNIVIDDVGMGSTYSRLVSLFPSTSGGAISNIYISHIVANTANGPILNMQDGGDSSPYGGVINNLTVDGITGYNQPGSGTAYVQIGSLAINDMSLNHINTLGSQGVIPNDVVIINGATAVIKNLKINDSSLNMQTNAGNYGIVEIASGAILKNLYFNNDDVTTSGTQSVSPEVVFVDSGATVNNISWTGGSLQGFASFIDTTGSVTPVLNIQNMLYNGRFLIGGSNVNATISGLTILGSNASLFNLYNSSKTYNLQLSNFTNPGAATLFNYGTTNTINLTGGDCTVSYDGTKITPAVGSMWRNSNAAYGSGVGCYIHSTLLAN